MKTKNFMAIFVLLFFLFEALKFVLEIIESHRNGENEHYLDPKDVTFCISAFNEEQLIYSTLESIYPYAVIVGDDGSTDNTIQEINRYIQNFPNRNVILSSKSNSGKVDTINQISSLVKTDYMIIADADIVLSPNFRIPVLGNATAMSFNVRPIKEKSIVTRLQDHEYHKSMDVGRLSKNSTKTVHCISGAMGLFRTERFKRLIEKHKGNYEGEDLSRTLIELNHGGKIIHNAEGTVYTDVPNTFKSLIRQRTKYWNPGLYFNALNMIFLIFRRSTNWRLRIEMLYEVISMILDPFKVIFLFLTSWWILSLLYVYYVIFEMVVKKVIKSDISYGLILIYPFYNLMLLFTRVASIPKSIVLFFNSYIKRKIFRRALLAFPILLFLLFPLCLSGQTVQGGVETFYFNNRVSANINLYGDYKSYFIDLNAFQNTSITVGKWINDGYANLTYSHTGNFLRTAGKIQLDGYKHYPYQYYICYGLSYRIDNNSFVESIGGDFQYIINDDLYISLIVGYENGYKNSPYFGERVKWKNLEEIFIYNRGVECSVKYTYRNFITAFSYESDYDFTRKSKYTLMVAYQFKFTKKTK